MTKYAGDDECAEEGAVESRNSRELSSIDVIRAIEAIANGKMITVGSFGCSTKIELGPQEREFGGRNGGGSCKMEDPQGVSEANGRRLLGAG